MAATTTGSVSVGPGLAGSMAALCRSAMLPLMVLFVLSTSVTGVLAADAPDEPDGCVTTTISRLDHTMFEYQFRNDPGGVGVIMLWFSNQHRFLVQERTVTAASVDKSHVGDQMRLCQTRRFDRRRCRTPGGDYEATNLRTSLS